MEPLAGLDSAFLALERPSEHLTMGAVLVLDPPPGSPGPPPATRFEEISALVASRLHLVPRFRQRVVGLSLGLEHPVWVDDPAFSLDHHLRRAAVPAPGERAELDGVVADLMAVPLDHRQPLWEMVVLEGLARGRSAVVARVHHAVLDGSSGADLLAWFLDLSAEPQPVPPAAPWTPPPLPSRLELLRRAASGALQRPSLALEVLRRGAELLAPGGEEEDEGTEPTKVPILDEAFRAPHTSLNGSLSPLRAYASCSVELEQVRRVGKAFEATINDVVLAATGSALRAYLAARQEVPASSLVAMVPVSTRRTGRHLRDGQVADAAGGAGNQLSAIFVPLGTDLDDPVERLRAVARRTSEAKAMDSASGGAVLEGLSQLLVPALIHPLARAVGALAGVSWLPALSNLVVSDITGPETTLWFAAGRVVELYPIGPVAGGIGLNVTAISYQGALHLGVLGCRRRVPDPEGLVQQFRASLDELTARAA